MPLLRKESEGGGDGGGGGGAGGVGGSMKKYYRRFGYRGDNSYGNNRGGCRCGERINDGGSMRRSQNQSGANSTGGGNRNNSNYNNVQTGKGSTSISAVDTNKLEPMLPIKKMGGLQQFLWNCRGAHSPNLSSNSFTAPSALIDSNIKRNDRVGPRNNYSYNKDSIKNGGNELQEFKVKICPPSSSSSRQQQLSSNINLNPTTSSVASNAASATVAVEYESPAVAPPFDEPTKEEKKAMQSAISNMIEAATNEKTLNFVIPCLTKFEENLRSYFVFMILSEYLHLRNVGQLERRYAANIVAFLFKRNYIHIEHFRLAYNQLCELVSDHLLDVPHFWIYIFQFAGPLMANKIITLNNLWNKALAEQNQGDIFLKSFFAYCTQEIGPDFTRQMWKISKLNLTDFMPESEVLNFIKTNKLAFLADEQPHIALSLKIELN